MTIKINNPKFTTVTKNNLIFSLDKNDMIINKIDKRKVFKLY